MRRTPSAVQLAYLDNLAALAAAPAEAVPHVAPPERGAAEPPRLAPAAPVPVPLRRRLRSAAPCWLLAAGLVLATQQGCSAAFGHDRVAPAAKPHRHLLHKPPLEGTTTQPAERPPADPAVLSPAEPAILPPPEPAVVASPSLATPLHDAGRVWPVAGAIAGLLAAGAVSAALLVRRRRRRVTVVPPPLDVALPTPAAAANGPWTIGFATETGPVRARNEDAGAVFCLGADRVAIVADGLGGMPEGADASAQAVRAAERFLRRACRRAAAGGRPAPSILLHGAFAAASAALACEGLRRGFTRREDGLRTTLLIAIATERDYHFGYIGDGGMFAVGADGAVRSLMTPQKAEGAALNVIAGSLGPLAHGAPVFGSAERLPGDLLAVVSDGVADRLPLRFYGHDRGLPHYLRLCGGDLAAGAARILSMLARELEGGLYRFDDNMTLALIGDGPAPDALAHPNDITEAA